MNRIHYLPTRHVRSRFHSQASLTAVGLGLFGVLAVLVFGLESMVKPSPAPYGALIAPAPSFRDVSVPDTRQQDSGGRADATDNFVAPQVSPDLGISQMGR
jgi:hypothetical protein